jgi:hypothetical protein
METGRKICEGADCYLIGSILPVVGALLGRRVYMPWGASKVYPNIFALLVGKPGDRKSSTIQIAGRIARECLTTNGIMPHVFSPESMFDEYYENPHKFWLIDDANPILNEVDSQRKHSPPEKRINSITGPNSLQPISWTKPCAADFPALLPMSKKWQCFSRFAGARTTAR